MDSRPPDRIAFLGGYVPRLCGIATFTHDLCEAVAGAAPHAQCFAAAMNDRVEGYSYPPRVRFQLGQHDLASYRRAADLLNYRQADVLCVQHEFGIYGGPAGSHVLSLLEEVRMPVVTTLHTVLREPDAAQRSVMEQLTQRSDRLVVMAHKGAQILHDTYGVPHSKVDIIPHGIPDMPFLDSSGYKAQFGVAGRTVLLTFGLLGPSKGIETAIGALPEIVKRHPKAVYLVLGATHPHLVARDGENYRLGLMRLAEELGVSEHVIFHNRYVSLDDLKQFIGATDVYLTPYLNEAQITSGTLAYVFGAGKAVVSTPYWHAQELLAGWRGILVPFGHPHAIAEGVCAFLDDPARLRRTREDAYQAGREMIWPAVAQRYLGSFQQARAERRARPRLTMVSRGSAQTPPAAPLQRSAPVAPVSAVVALIQYAASQAPACSEQGNMWALRLCRVLRELGGERPSARLGRHCLEGIGRGVLYAADSLSLPGCWASALPGIQEYLRRFAGCCEAGHAPGVTNISLVGLQPLPRIGRWAWIDTGATDDLDSVGKAPRYCGQRLPPWAEATLGSEPLDFLACGPARGFEPIGRHEQQSPPVDVVAHAIVLACLDACGATQNAAWSREAERPWAWLSHYSESSPVWTAVSPADLPPSMVHSPCESASPRPACSQAAASNAAAASSPSDPWGRTSW